MASGRYVMLAVGDTGCGMDYETQAHIFDPFFTTKELGKGTGLGLSTVYGIIKQSDGFIWVDSEPGQGAIFKIYLPQAEEVAETVEPEATSVPRPRGVETILLVEDEKGVRAMIRHILKQEGYTVLEAGNSQEAFLHADQHKGAIQLMVTDVVMPGMGGRQVAERIKSSRPDMKVLFVSGYTGDAIAHHGVLDKGVNFLEKPFTAEGLTSKVRGVLDTNS
jgi:CheY-like chemotaxis protein